MDMEKFPLETGSKFSGPYFLVYSELFEDSMETAT